jgi:hypothetical protein
MRVKQELLLHHFFSEQPPDLVSAVVCMSSPLPNKPPPAVYRPVDQELNISRIAHVKQWYPNLAEVAHLDENEVREGGGTLH